MGRGKGKGKGEKGKGKGERPKLKIITWKRLVCHLHSSGKTYMTELADICWRYSTPTSPHPHKCWPLQLSKRCKNKHKGKICISSQAVQTLVFAHNEFPSAAPQGTALCVFADTE